MSEFDKYEKVPNMKDYGIDRPEYILKNGKARNCYGLLNDITELQTELTAKTDIIAELNAENVRLKGERDELKSMMQHLLDHDCISDCSLDKEISTLLERLS